MLLATHHSTGAYITPTIGGFVRTALRATYLLLVLSYSATAAPVITEASGTFDHKSLVTIKGSGFGSKPQAAPVLWDTVDNISTYGALSNGDAIPMGGKHPWPSPYGNSSGRNEVKFNTTDSQRGVSTAQYKATNTKSAYLDGLTWSPTNYAYISWWWKTDKNVSAGDHSSKFLRVSVSSDETGQTFSWTQMHAYIWYNGGYPSPVSWAGFNGNPGNWNFMEAWFDSAKRTWAARANGRTLHNSSWSGSSIQFNELWKVGFDGGGVAPPSVTWWMDDIYVDSSLARVMLGNASTFDMSTQFEMQIPISWSASSISVGFNQGSFATGGKAYLYIVDQNGTVNSSGFPVTIGAGAVSVPPPSKLRFTP